MGRTLPGRGEKHFAAWLFDCGHTIGCEMPQKPRPHRVTVKLDRQEDEGLVARAAAVVRTKSQVVRDAIQETSRKDARPASSGLTASRRSRSSPTTRGPVR